MNSILCSHTPHAFYRGCGCPPCLPGLQLITELTYAQLELTHLLLCTTKLIMHLTHTVHCATQFRVFSAKRYISWDWKSHTKCATCSGCIHPLTTSGYWPHACLDPSHHPFLPQSVSLLVAGEPAVRLPKHTQCSNMPPYPHLLCFLPSPAQLPPMKSSLPFQFCLCCLHTRLQQVALLAHLHTHQIGATISAH